MLLDWWFNLCNTGVLRTVLNAQIAFKKIKVLKCCNEILTVYCSDCVCECESNDADKHRELTG